MTVCVVIPTYNRRRLVVRAVESVLDQTRMPAEIVVVDDGSTDGTADALQARFRGTVSVLRQTRRGVAAARNAGIRASSAPIIAFLDSDDTWTPDKIELQLPSMQSERVVLSATNWRPRGGKSDVFSDLKIPLDATVLHTPLQHLVRPEGHGLWTSTWMVRRDAFLSCGGFDEGLRVAEDTDLVFRLARSGSFAIVPQVLAERSITVDEQQLTNYGDFRYLCEISHNAVEILRRLCSDFEDAPPELRRAAARLFSYHLRRHTENLALSGRRREARAGGRELLRVVGGPKEKLTAMAALIVPQLVAARRRRSLLRDGVDLNPPSDALPRP